jgi:hypothetical protein
MPQDSAAARHSSPTRPTNAPNTLRATFRQTYAGTGSHRRAAASPYTAPLGGFDHARGDETTWNGNQLRGSCTRGISPAYRHKVYWRDVNTLRDKVVFEQKWASRALRDGTVGPTCLPSVHTSVLVTGNSDRAMTLQRRS